MFTTPKISVVIICYKQEELIKRAIDSALAQKEYIYEICVSDDCSPDKTWEVLQDYDKRFPGLFKLNRNDPNIGIFQNVEKSWTMPTGNLIVELAGDDEFGPDWLKSVYNFVVDNNLDCENEMFCIYGDDKAQYPNGDFFVKESSLINKGYEPMSLTIRGLIGTRTRCVSKAIYKKRFSVASGRSYVAEWAQDRQIEVFCKKAYYIPTLASIYYTRIGVNVHFDKKILCEREDNFPYMEKCFQKVGYKFNKKDSYYIALQGERYKAHRDKSFSHLWRVFVLTIKSKDYRFGFFNVEKKKIKRYAFALLRRLPHNKPISMTI